MTTQQQPPRKSIQTIAPTRTKMPEQKAEVRNKNFDEVSLGYTPEMARGEAARCLNCKNAQCIQGCPVGIDIPGFIAAIEQGDFEKSYRILRKDNLLPAVCGRVCPQESQCEKKCIVGIKKEPVAIGRLERFIGDLGLQKGWKEEVKITKVGKKVAMVGSGPASITAAADLARAGVDVTIFEALHTAGGVLKYGIPEFRLPKKLIDAELAGLESLGVKVVKNSIIGRLFTIPQLMKEKGFDAVFIATGAGAPSFMNVPGEGYNGVFSANEFLTRVNLMRAFDRSSETPIGMGRNVAVVGAGNTAMDACRVAKRLGAENVYCIYRRSRAEAPARVEEIEHAIEEGVQFHWLTAPLKLLGDEYGRVRAMECVKMELGEPDASGRRRPVPVTGSEFLFQVDTVVPAIGTNANGIIAATTPGLKTNKWGYIEANPETQATNIPGVFAGGDIVTGGATVILAMGAGRRAAQAILKYLNLV
jgi:glutamate synthase (NADPH/NADH) small chain